MKKRDRDREREREVISKQDDLLTFCRYSRFSADTYNREIASSKFLRNARRAKIMINKSKRLTNIVIVENYSEKVSWLPKCSIRSSV